MYKSFKWAASIISLAEFGTLMRTPDPSVLSEYVLMLNLRKLTF